MFIQVPFTCSFQHLSFKTDLRPLQNSIEDHPLKLRKISFVALVLSLLFLSSCGATRRFGKDVSMGVLSPVLTIYGGATDAYAGQMIDIRFEVTSSDARYRSFCFLAQVRGR